MDPVRLPPGAWDCHVHCFDPERHPFRPDRAYTPPPAPLDSLVAQQRASHVMLVQASIENGPRGLLSHLAELHQRFPSVVALGTICTDENNLDALTQEDFDSLHRAGVRSIRIHGIHGPNGRELGQVEAQIRALSQCWGVRKYRWSLSAQLPLQTWSSLGGWILSDPEIAHVLFIADHNGSAAPDELDSSAFDVFVRLLQAGRLLVKVSALYRRSPRNVSEMGPVVRRFANAAPRSLLWGSDWPHVVSTRGVLSAEPKIDAELVLLNDWLSETQWMQMLVDNPQRIWGAASSR